MRDPSICLFIPTLEGGGAERVFVNLANFFSINGVDTHLLVGNARGPNREFLLPSVKVTDYEALKTPFIIGRLLTSIRRIRPNSVMTTLDLGNAMVGCILPFLPDNTLFVARQAALFNLNSKKHMREKLFARLALRSFKRANIVICNSVATKASIENALEGPLNNSVVIPNPVITEKYVRDANIIRKKHTNKMHKERKKRVISIGRLIDSKGFDALIKSFQGVIRHQDATLHIFGTGPNINILESLIRELDLEDSVFLEGYSSNIFQELAEADLFVSASTSEGFGNVIVEALGSGTPVIAMEGSGGPIEILENGVYGEIMPSRNIAAMTETIIRSLSTPPPIAETTRRQNRALDFAIERVGLRYLNALVPEHKSFNAVSPTE